MKKLRVGYILDNSDQSFFIWEAINQSKNSDAYSVEALIIQNTVDKNSKSKGLFLKAFQYISKRGIKKFIESISFYLILKFEKIATPRNAKYRDFYLKYSLDKFDYSKFYVNPNISDSGLNYSFGKEDLNTIKNLDLDLLVRGGSGILRGDILTICKFGIISFHHSNNAINRGGPPGFWEVFNREPSTGFIIQKLLNELDGGDVLFKGSFPTSFLYTLNLSNLYFNSNIFLHLLIERISMNNALPKAYSKSPYTFQHFTLPSMYQQMAYLIKTFVHGMKKILGKVRGKVYRWGIAYQFVDDWKNAVLWRSKVIKNPPNRFLADPFVKVKNGRVIVFVEDYDYSLSKGKISAYELFKSGYKELGCVLEENFHLSFPFIFEEDGSLYMCPETKENNDIRVYKCVNFPLQWELHKILFSDVKAVDTTIFKYNQKYWLLSNIDSTSLGNCGSELHLFYADSFESNEWKSHPNNPIIFDSLTARNGGFITDNGDLYRVFQTPGFNIYGKSMGIAKITELSDSNYQEELSFNITPDFFKNIKGTHTFSHDDGVLLFDFVKYESRKK